MALPPLDASAAKHKFVSQVHSHTHPCIHSQFAYIPLRRDHRCVLELSSVPVIPPSRVRCSGQRMPPFSLHKHTFSHSHCNTIACPASIAYIPLRRDHRCASELSSMAVISPSYVRCSGQRMLSFSLHKRTFTHIAEHLLSQSSTVVSCSSVLWHSSRGACQVYFGILSVWS